MSETVHIVEAFEAGGVDCVVKPVRAAEVLVRLSTHLRNARAVRLAREAVDVAGRGVLLIDAQGRIGWRSLQAAAWLHEFFPNGAGQLPPAWERWLIDAGLAAGAADHIQSSATDRTLRVRHLGPVGLGERMLLLQLLRQRSTPADTAANTRVTEAHLTPRETKVRLWVAKGKTNRDVADILGKNPAPSTNTWSMCLKSWGLKRGRRQLRRRVGRRSEGKVPTSHIHHTPALTSANRHCVRRCNAASQSFLVGRCRRCLGRRWLLLLGLALQRFGAFLFFTANTTVFVSAHVDLNS